MATEPQPAPERQRTPGQGQGASALPRHSIRRTRVSGAWIAITCFAVVLLLLLIFILENSRTVDVAYFGAHGHLPLGVALLLAAIFGVLLVALPGTARIIQLRRTARKHRKDDAQAVAGQAVAGHAVAGQPASASDTSRTAAPD